MHFVIDFGEVISRARCAGLRFASMGTGAAGSTGPVTAYPIRTERLTLRIMRPADADVFVAYRNDPEVARHQNWTVPYTIEDARRDLEQQSSREDLSRGAWTQIAIEHDGAVIGDVCAHLDETGGVADIGYTLAREHWGHGYATEAARALVTDLIDRVGVGRVLGEIDPANDASARVLERIGLLHESDSRHSYLSRAQWCDNTTYAATAADWRAWRTRLSERPREVRLIELGPDTHEAYGRLETQRTQRKFVSSMAGNYGTALFPPLEKGVPLIPVLRGIEVDGEPAGFLMYAAASATVPEPYLWRLLIDASQQGRGVGRQAVNLLAADLAGQGHEGLVVSFVDAPGGPKEFYLRCGFELTGTMNDDEVEARRRL